MSSPQLASAVTAQAGAAQVGLALVVQREVQAAMPGLARVPTEQLPAAVSGFLQHITQKYGAASAALAARQYAVARRASDLLTPFRVKPAAVPDKAYADKTASWVLDSTTDIGQEFESQLVASAEKMTLDVGRNTIIQNVQSDKAAKGWARIPEPDCCAFCALLATRGVSYKAYKSEASASFKAHENCRCHVDPVFNSYEPSAQVRQWQAQYADATAKYDGKAKLIAWRQAFEGRKVTGGK